MEKKKDVEIWTNYLEIKPKKLTKKEVKFLEEPDWIEEYAKR